MVPPTKKPEDFNPSPRGKDDFDAFGRRRSSQMKYNEDSGFLEFNDDSSEDDYDEVLVEQETMR